MTLSTFGVGLLLAAISATPLFSSFCNAVSLSPPFLLSSSYFLSGITGVFFGFLALSSLTTTFSSSTTLACSTCPFFFSSTTSIVS